MDTARSSTPRKVLTDMVEAVLLVIVTCNDLRSHGEPDHASSWRARRAFRGARDAARKRRVSISIAGDALHPELLRIALGAGILPVSAQS